MTANDNGGEFRAFCGDVNEVRLRVLGILMPGVTTEQTTPAVAALGCFEAASILLIGLIQIEHWDVDRLLPMIDVLRKELVRLHGEQAARDGGHPTLQ